MHNTIQQHNLVSQHNSTTQFHNTINKNSGPGNGTKKMYNTNGFRTETMYDYYIAMKSMFLVVKLSSHSSIGYASPTIFLPRTTHKQHQNYSKPKAFQNQNFNSHKLCIHTIISYKWRCPSRSQNTFLNTNQKETNQESS